MKLKFAIRMVLSASTLAGYAGVAASQEAPLETAGIEEIIVTAQKREESLQTVPIAVTALTGDALASQRINLAEDLARAVPNLYFSRAGLGFNETNFQLRGIGYQLVSTSGDAGVGVHVNNAPLSVNRMSQGELYDLERIEVLRGPQGTLYGRNATGGVINMITAKPSIDGFSGEGALEYGDYDHRRISGHVNMPFGEVAALRIAGFTLERDGYTRNTWTGQDVDGRDMWSGRATLALNPLGAIRATLMWERTDADDDRIGNTKSVCAKDPGLASVGGVTVNDALARAFLSRGCAQGDVYGEAAYGSVNYAATQPGLISNLAGVVSGDIYAGVTQSTDLREVVMRSEPSYVAQNDLYELNVEIDVTDELKLTSLTSYLDDEVYARSPGVSYAAARTFNTTPVTPGGVYNDPQLGASAIPDALNISDLSAKQWSQELRLQSDFDGAFNFNVGGMYLNLERLNDIYMLSSAQNAYVDLINFAGQGCAPACSIYLDRNPTPDGTGHNYFLSRNPYELKASALFGEVYWDVTDRFRLTTGVRYTEDKKEIDLHPVTMLSAGRGWPATGALAPIEQEANFEEYTGRVNGAWRATDDNMVYVSYSKGYKGGGINTPDVATGNLSPTYEPEFVNAYEIGSKNEFADGRVQVNLTGFYYDYEGYQISQLRGLTSATENVDAEIKGVELESVWAPTASVRFNANLGWLNTRLTEGQSVDVFDRTQGDPSLTFVRSISSACVAPTAAMAQFVTLMNSGTTVPGLGRALVPQDMIGICGGSFSSMGLIPSDGVAVDLEGKELPQSPELTASVGAQYRWDFASGWSATLRGDYYMQSDAFTRIYNSQSDVLKKWDNANASLTVSNDTLGWDVQLYAKNLMDEDVITGFDTGADALGLVRNLTVLEPRLVGVVVKKKF